MQPNPTAHSHKMNGLLISVFGQFGAIVNFYLFFSPGASVYSSIMAVLPWSPWGWLYGPFGFGPQSILHQYIPKLGESPPSKVLIRTVKNTPLIPLRELIFSNLILGTWLTMERSTLFGVTWISWMPEKVWWVARPSGKTSANSTLWLRRECQTLVVLIMSSSSSAWLVAGPFLR